MCGSSLFPYTPTSLSDAMDLICCSSSNNLPQVGGRSWEEDRLVVAIKDLPWPMASTGELDLFFLGSLFIAREGWALW